MIFASSACGRACSLGCRSTGAGMMISAAAGSCLLKGHPRRSGDAGGASATTAIASLIGHSGSSAFRPTTTTAVSMSLTGSCFSAESAPGPSIMEVEDEAEQSTERPCCNERQVQAIARTHLIHRPARDVIPPQGGARVPPIVLSDVILHGSHAAVGTCSLVLRNSVPSTQMRCRITAKRRARATIAFFMPRRLAICIAQALSHRPLGGAGQHDLGRFVEHHPHHLVSAA